MCKSKQLFGQYFQDGKKKQNKPVNLPSPDISIS